MLHVVDVPDFLRLAHLADGIGGAEVVDRYAGPAPVRHPDLAPLARHGHGPTLLSPSKLANLYFTWLGWCDIKAQKKGHVLLDLVSMTKLGTQRDQAIELLRSQGMMRLSEFKVNGITAATIGRMVRGGDVIRLARGLYQLPDAPLDANHSLAEAAKRVPRGVVCLVSALAYHELTDQLPRAVWMAIGTRDWMPKEGGPTMRIVRFTDALLTDDVMTVHIENVPVKVFGVAKTIADCFRHRRKVGQTVALEGLQEALRQRKTSPAEIARHAERGGVATVVRPYLEALTANA